MTDLMELASRVEAGEGPDRSLDHDIQDAVRLDGYTADRDGCSGNLCGTMTRMAADGDGVEWKPLLAYTASLDAAMSLIEADEYWRLGNDGEGPDPAAFKATVTSHDDEAMIHFHDAVAETAALALCCAALRARAHQGTAHVEQ